MRVAAPIALLLGIVCGGCKKPSPTCATMGSSGLLQQAALVRLDVYGGNTQCAGDMLAPGAPSPLQSSVVSAGHPIQLDVPAGRHVLLLSAYSDAAATHLIATACDVVTLKANEPACFNLTLAPAPIAGCSSNADCAATPATPLCLVADHRCVTCLAGSDCPPDQRCSPSGSCVDGCDPTAGSTCDSSLMCCSTFCLDTTTDIDNCGGCARACLATADAGVAVANCGGSLCKPVCLDGFADCTEPPAPAADDGCETNIHTPEHCGGCNTPCMLANANAACPSGSCTIASCMTNFVDCNGQPADGCECPQLADANHGCCPPSSLVNPNGCEGLHSDGFGDSFIDCYAVGAYSLQLATDAATAFVNPGATITTGGCGAGSLELVACSVSAAKCACFVYKDTSGANLVGKATSALAVGPLCSACPTASTTNVDWF